METQKIINLFNYSSKEASKVAIKNWYVIDSQTAKDKYNQNNSIKCETESIKSSLIGDAFILVTGDMAVNAGNDTHVGFQNCAPFSTLRQKLMMFSMTKQIIFTVLCLCTIRLNSVIIIQIHQEVYGTLKETNLQIIMLIRILRVI